MSCSCCQASFILNKGGRKEKQSSQYGQSQIVKGVPHADMDGVFFVYVQSALPVSPGCCQQCRLQRPAALRQAETASHREDLPRPRCQSRPASLAAAPLISQATGTPVQDISMTIRLSNQCTLLQSILAQSSRCRQNVLPHSHQTSLQGQRVSLMLASW